MRGPRRHRQGGHADAVCSASAKARYSEATDGCLSLFLPVLIVSFFAISGTGTPLSLKVVAADVQVAGVGGDERGEDLDGGGLAGAVRTEQREDGTGRDAQVDAVEDGLVSVGLAQADGGDGGLRRVTVALPGCGHDRRSYGELWGPPVRRLKCALVGGQRPQLLDGGVQVTGRPEDGGVEDQRRRPFPPGNCRVEAPSRKVSGYTDPSTEEKR